MEKLISATILSHSNRMTFRMRLVTEGMRYGRDMCLTHDKPEPLVEFYDARFDFDRDTAGNMLGQFVSRYYVRTLLKAPGGGLDLQGDVDLWKVDAPAMDVARAILRNWTA